VFSSVAFAAALAAFPMFALAEPKAEIGFRSGYGIPFGTLSESAERPGDDGGDAIGDFARGQFPVWFDIGARLNENLFVGGYFQYGVVVFSKALARECDELDQRSSAANDEGRADCSFHDLRIGAEVQFHFGKPTELLDPWVGGGVGYEWLSLGVFHEDGFGRKGNLSETFHGFEFLNAQAGLDLRVSDTTAFGPFLTFTLSSYRIVRSDCDGDCASFAHGFEPIDGTSLHHWLFVGVRGSFRL
jgi:hypothetical protein